MLYVFVLIYSEYLGRTKFFSSMPNFDMDGERRRNVEKCREYYQDKCYTTDIE